jgi:hypothetical protein
MILIDLRIRLTTVGSYSAPLKNLIVAEIYKLFKTKLLTCIFLDSTALESIDGNSFKDNSLAISPIWSIQFKQVVGSLTAGEIL